jgi:PAS domain-containing protein
MAAFWDRIHPDDRPLIRQTWRQATRDKNRFQGDYRIVLPDGSLKYMQTIAHPFVNQSGGFEFIGTSMDITHRTLTVTCSKWG